MIRVKVMLALLLQDDFNGEIIQNPRQQFWLDEQKATPIRKPDGFYVFTQSVLDGSQLRIESAGYKPAVIKLNYAEGNLENSILEVRLERTNPALFRDGAKSVTGKGKASTRVVAIAEDEKPLRFQTSGVRDGKQWVLLQGYSVQPMLNRRFCITEGSKTEYFIITEKNMDGTLSIQSPLKGKFTSGSTVRRVYTTTSSSAGQYTLCVDDGREKGEFQMKYLKEEGLNWLYKYVAMHK